MVVRSLVSNPTPRAKHGDAGVDVSDNEVIEAVKRDDPRAGGLLYDRLSRVVEWTVVRIVGRRAIDHEDLIQASFEQIYITLLTDKFEGNCSLTSWASALSCRIALNALRAERQRGRLRQHSELELQAYPTVQSGSEVERKLDAQRRLAQIRVELSRMSARRAQVLVLHEVNGLALAEIAHTLDISVAAAQSHLSRGRRELIRRLKAADGKAADGKAECP
jgi:RNA polymerase sigma-70 factor (ECF subfamily)